MRIIQQGGTRVIINVPEGVAVTVGTLREDHTIRGHKGHYKYILGGQGKGW